MRKLIRRDVQTLIFNVECPIQRPIRCPNLWMFSGRATNCAQVRTKTDRLDACRKGDRKPLYDGSRLVAILTMNLVTSTYALSIVLFVLQTVQACVRYLAVFVLSFGHFSYEAACLICLDRDGRFVMLPVLRLPETVCSSKRSADNSW